MVWPITPLGTSVELYLGPELGWVDITDDVRLESAASGGGISITRGRSAEGQDSEHTRCNLTIDNRSGKYSPRNPLSPYYGKLGRNTPLRVRVAESSGQVALAVSGKDVKLEPGRTRCNYVDHQATGAIDVRIDCSMPNGWKSDAYEFTGTPAVDRYDTVLCGKWTASDPNRAWHVLVTPEGKLRFLWSSDGTNAGIKFQTSTAPVVPGGTDRLAVRVTFDPATGLVTFYQAPTIAGPWVVVGDPRVFGATTLVPAAGSDMQIGGVRSGVGSSLAGYVYAFQFLKAGVLVHDVDFADAEPGAVDYTDPQGHVWSFSGPGVQYIDIGARCYTEVTVWPPRWDLGQFDKWVPIEASGITRRLMQGASPRSTPLYRTLLKRNPAAYLPLEDEDGANRPSSAATGVRAGESVEVTFGNEDAPPGSKASAQLGLGGLLSTGVAIRSNTTWWAMFFFKLDHLPTPGDYRKFARVYIDGGAIAYLDFDIGDTGSALKAYNKKGVFLFEQSYGWGSFATFPDPRKWMSICIQIRQDPGNIVRFGRVWHQVGDTLFYGTYEGPSVSGAVGRISRVEIQANTEHENVAVTHLIVNDGPSPIFEDEFRQASNGYIGELAGYRMARLCREDGIPLHIYGQSNKTLPMGKQPSAPLVELLRQCAKTDGGILAESRGMLGFMYRTRRSLYNQPHLPLSFSGGYVADPFLPSEDDDATVNDMTVNRDGGGSARYVLEEGPLSIEAPPEGVGTYDASETVNIATDDPLYDIAGWRVSLGTVDEARYPKITADLSSSAWVADPVRTQQAADLDFGDCLAVTDLPDTLPPGDAGAIIQGYTEKLDAFDWRIGWNATPSSAWQVGVVGTARIGAKGSTLASAVAADATTLVLESVEENGIWTTNPAHFPQDLRVGEEVVTVSAIGPLVLDPFTRTTAADWGYEPVTGLPWQTSGSAGSSNTNGTRAQHNYTAVPGGRDARLDIGAANVDITVVMGAGFTPTGGNVEQGIMVRWNGGSTYLDVRLFRVATGGVTMAIRQMLAGVETFLGFPAVPGLASSGSANVRVQAFGPKFRGKAWAVGTKEPGGWLMELDVTHLGSGSLVLRGGLPSNLTNALPVTLFFDDLRINHPQRVGVAYSTPAVNLNPRFEVDASDWSGRGATLVRSTAQAHEGSASGLLTPGGVDTFPRADANMRDVPSKRMWAQAWVRPTTANKAPQIAVHAFDSAGTYITTRGHTLGTLVAGLWQPISTPVVDFSELPAGTKFAITVGLINTGGTAPAATDTMYFDEAELHPEAGYPGTVVLGRGVNGRAFAWPAGTPVDIAQRSRIAL